MAISTISTLLLSPALALFAVTAAGCLVFIPAAGSRSLLLVAPRGDWGVLGLRASGAAAAAAADDPLMPPPLLQRVTLLIPSLDPASLMTPANVIEPLDIHMRKEPCIFLPIPSFTCFAVLNINFFSHVFTK